MKKIILSFLVAFSFTLSAQIPVPNSISASSVAANYWSQSGSAISSSKWLGSNNAQPLTFKTNNTTRLIIGSTGTFSFNPGLLPASETASIQIGTNKILVGDITASANTPVFLEFLKSNGSGGALNIRGSVGYLGATEMNLSSNMNYTGAIHKYYDPTVPASWLYLGTGTDILGTQYVPANNTNTVDIYTNYGCRPFYVELYTQPSTGRGINGFSRTNTAILSLADLSNTSVATNPATTLSTNSTQFTADGAISYYFQRNANGGTLLASSNSNSGSGAYARLYAVSNSASASLFALSSGYTNSGILVQNTSVLHSAAGAGLSVGTSNSAYLKFWTNNVERASINSSGTFSVNGSSVFTGGYSLKSTSTDPVVGNATLVGGTVTVNTTKAVTGCFIMLTRKTSGGTIGTTITYTISNGTSFTITSDNVLDTSTFTWMIVNP